MDQNLRLLFTEMLRRTGRCRALYDGPEGMLLQTGGNGLFCGIPDADALLRVLRGVTVPKDAGFTVFSHEAADAVQREFGLHAQEAYETLLYLQPSPPEVPACSIRPLTAEDSAEAARYYHLFDDPQPYLRGRAEAGALWGHFTAEGRLAGFLGIHSEGSMGMLEVVPEFRRHGIAQFCVRRRRQQAAQFFSGQQPALPAKLQAAERVERIAVCEPLPARAPVDGARRLAGQKVPQRQHSAFKQAIIDVVRLSGRHRLPQRNQRLRGGARNRLAGEDEDVQIAPAEPEIPRHRRTVQIHRRTAADQQAADRLRHPGKRAFQTAHVSRIFTIHTSIFSRAGVSNTRLHFSASAASTA